MAEPHWWYGDRLHPKSILLSPLGMIYGAIAAARLGKPPLYTPGVPVLCVGNFTAGGTGKTPLCIALAEIVRGLGRQPVMLSRGYGGQTSGPIVVDPHTCRAQDVGDEPLLLARAATTVVAKDRAAGARFIEKEFGGNTVILMDDGLQNPSIAKDLTIAVVDAVRAWGNGRCLPAGPLRAPLAAQIGHIDVLVINGAASQASAATRAQIEKLCAKPLIAVTITAAGDLKWLKGARVLAFAGIANPWRFFDLLERQGALLVARHAFNDHENFTQAHAQALLDEAHGQNARLVTTEKDFVRLYGAQGALAELREKTLTLPVSISFPEADGEVLRRLVAAAIAARSRT